MKAADLYDTDFAQWAQRWVYGVSNRAGYIKLLGEDRVAALRERSGAGWDQIWLLWS